MSWFSNTSGAERIANRVTLRSIDDMNGDGAVDATDLDLARDAVKRDLEQSGVSENFLLRADKAMSRFQTEIVVASDGASFVFGDARDGQIDGQISADVPWANAGYFNGKYLAARVDYRGNMSKGNDNGMYSVLIHELVHAVLSRLPDRAYNDLMAESQDLVRTMRQGHHRNSVEEAVATAYARYVHNDNQYFEALEPFLKLFHD